MSEIAEHTVVTDAEAAEMCAVADDMAEQGGENALRLTGQCVARIGKDMNALLADRDALLAMLRESVDDQLHEDELPNGDKRLRCDMCGVVLTYWQRDGGKHERAHNEGCLIPKWEALLKEAGRA